MPYGNAPTPLVSGLSAVPSVLQGYVFASGIHDPEHSKILAYKYPQYYATSLLDRLGASSGLAQDTWSWSIMDRTRKAGTAADPNGGTVLATQISGGSTTLVLDTDYAYTAAKPGYLLVGDVVRFASGALGEVTAVAAGGSGSDLQKVTVRRVGGGNWTTGEVTNGMKFGHTHTMFGEGSSAPSHRLYLPREESNALAILRRSLKISGSEFTNRTILGDGAAWYFELEGIEQKEFAKDREMAIMFGKFENDFTAVPSKKSTRGIWDYVTTYGKDNGYASATGVAEEDIQNQIKELMLEGCSDTLTVLAGADFMIDFQREMKDYQLNGGVQRGGWQDLMVGLDVTAYKFMGKTIYVKYYELFDDPEILPYAGTPTSALTDFSKASLWLDLGVDSAGQKLISLKHKELNGVSRKYIHAWEAGLMKPDGSVGGQVANGDDAFRIHMLSEIGVEVRFPNRMGILRATS